MLDTRTRTRPVALAALALLLAAAAAPAADAPLRVIVFGAHPDDCDLDAGGTAALWAAKGHQVKFVSVTNGDAGHQSEGGGALARRRRAEAQEAGRRFGIAEYEVLDNHDGELEPTLAVRQQVIRRIRQWNADVVIAPRPNDYHPDHRYTGVLVQDTAYMVVVPNVCPDTPPLRKNPVFLYSQDGFQRPNPFRPDVAVAIDPVIDQKIRALDAHVSQVYEWLPWVEGVLDTVPKDPAARLRLAAAAEERPADRRGRAGGAAEVVRAAGRCGEERRGLRGLRVRPAAERGRPAPPLPVLRLRTPGVSGPRTRRLRSILKRRERTTPERRPALDARGLGVLARPLAIVYTDTDDFTHRAARDGILHFLMCFDRALRQLRPGVTRNGGRVVKVEADSLHARLPGPPVGLPRRRLHGAGPAPGQPRPTDERAAGLQLRHRLRPGPRARGRRVRPRGEPRVQARGGPGAAGGGAAHAVRGRDAPRSPAPAPRPLWPGGLRRSPHAGPAAAAASITRSHPMSRRTAAAACLGTAMLAAAGHAAARAGAALGPGQAPPAPTPMERITLPPAPLRESPSLLESSPAGWTSVQPGPDLAGWTRGPWPTTATLGPQQWSVDPATGHLVCDGQGGHEWLRYDREMGDAAFHVEWRFSPVEGADKYNSGVLARTALDLSVWHQAQVGLKGGLPLRADAGRRRGEAGRPGARGAAGAPRRRVEHLRDRRPAAARSRSGSTARSRARSRSTCRAATSDSRPRAGGSSSAT